MSPSRITWEGSARRIFETQRTNFFPQGYLEAHPGFLLAAVREQILLLLGTQFPRRLQIYSWSLGTHPRYPSRYGKTSSQTSCFQTAQIRCHFLVRPQILLSIHSCRCHSNTCSRVGHRG